MKKFSSFLKIILPLGVGLFFIYLSFNGTSKAERALIYNYIQSADLWFVSLSVCFGILSHLSRAYRWKYLLSPLGYSPRFINSILAVLIAYIANLGIPRSGEVLRATTLSSYEKIPFDQTFGTIVAERIIDLLILIGFILVALLLQFDIIWSILEKKNIALPELGLLILFIILISTILSFFNFIKLDTTSPTLKT